MPNSQCCPKCKKIEAGVSKRTGKPYDAFWTCQSIDCPNYKPPRNTNPGFEKVQYNQPPQQAWLEERFDDLRQMCKKCTEVRLKLTSGQYTVNCLHNKEVIVDKR